MLQIPSRLPRECRKFQVQITIKRYTEVVDTILRYSNVLHLHQHVCQEIGDTMVRTSRFTGIFDMRPTESRHESQKTESGEHRRKNRNGHRIPILEVPMLAMFGESDSVLMKLLSTRNEICWLMLRMLSPSTGSESFRRRHVFVPCGSDAWNCGRDTFTCALRVMCCCVIFASAYTSAGPLSLVHNGVFTLVITSGCTD